MGFCGDGINDVPGLQAADVGLAVGASEAVVAAPVVSLSGSVMRESLLTRTSMTHPQLEIPFACLHILGLTHEVCQLFTCHVMTVQE